MAAERQYLRLGSSPSRLPVRSVQYASVADLNVRKYQLAVVRDRGCAIQTALGTSNNDDFFVELIAGASATVILAHNLS